MVRGGSATPTTVTHGIPQGSIVGPILFSLFCNDLPCYLEVEPVIYADDAHLLDRANPDTQNLTALKARIENTLSIMQNWYRSNSQQLVPRRFDLCSWLVRRSPTTPPAPQRRAASNCRGAGWSAPSARSDTAPQQHGMICRLRLPAADLYGFLSAPFVSVFISRACVVLF